MFNPAENDLNSFIQTSRTNRAQSMTTTTPRATSLYPPPIPLNFETQSNVNFNGSHSYRSLSPDDIQKLKYKIDLDKQVAEKKQRRAHEWETKIQRDRKYVQHQPFGRHEHSTVINKQQLDEILSKGRAPSPSLDMPQQLSVQYQQPYASNGGSTYGSSQQSSYTNYSQYPPYPTMQTKPPSPQKFDQSQNNHPDFQRFYGPNRNANGTSIQPSSAASTTTAQPIRGDAHDPFLLYDPNKEGQNVFNIIPQQDLYDPWGRPGGGAPLIHQPTGQKFTRYSGSLQEKLNMKGPLGFFRKQYSGDIDEQKRDLEMEQRRRQQEEMEHRSNAGDTAEWISQLESSRYPLKLHLPTTQTTREYIGARDRSRYDQSRLLHNDLVNQAEERSRMQQMNRRQNSLAELQHTEAQNSWWGRSGGGAPTFTSRRHNVANTFENSRQKWTTNHLGQLIMADEEPQGDIRVYDKDFYYPKTKSFSSHKNQYESMEENQD